jgi:hypothetical protein
VQRDSGQTWTPLGDIVSRGFDVRGVPISERAYASNMAEELVISESPLITLLLCAASIPVVVLFFVLGPVWFGLLTVIAALGFSYERLFRYAYAVWINSDGAIQFRSVLRRSTTRATDVQSISLRRWGWGESNKVKVAVTSGSVLLSSSDQTLALAVRVRSFNPGLRTRGL